MTATAKYVIDKLLDKGYLMPWRRHTGAKCFRLFDDKGIVICNVTVATVRRLDKYLDPDKKLWKRDRYGRMTLNLSTVRQLHGKNTIKKMYKQKQKQDEKIHDSV